MDSFDEAYARYLKFLALLDRTDDIGEKNLLFRQLTQLLADLERRLNGSDTSPVSDELYCEEANFNYTS
ncbi:hypothetical protein GEOBRER4_n2910 [Citrifermentans bremense]|uniref:Uncharacterized protein n=2 Tax=Geobacteraceae TaxID=213422 RepID=A0ABQ0MEU2_9BACT|nr:MULTISPECIES: hypothetical protein [Geobacteraceae]BCG48044.1 hypothetical protein GEOBRER4_n2910 [Citrifermentans bremense]GAW65620.1 hypothetical protein GPEL0_01f0604 [Geoanaerobacter pelophilus]